MALTREELVQKLQDAVDEVDRLNAQARDLVTAAKSLVRNVEASLAGTYVIDATTTQQMRAVVRDAELTERPKHQCHSGHRTEGFACVGERRNFRHEWDSSHIGGPRRKCLECGDVTGNI